MARAAKQSRAIHLCFLCFLFVISGRAQEEPSLSPSLQPVDVSDEDIASHRLSELQPIVMHLKDGPEEWRGAGSTIPVKLVVGADGSVLSAMLGEEIDSDEADEEVPKQWITEFKRVAAKALEQARSLRYKPFIQDGQPIVATFEEGIPAIPPEMLPGPKIEFPAIRNWKSLRMKLERTACYGMCPSYSVEVHGDGTVLYEGQNFVAVTGTHRAWVPRETVLALYEAFRKADYFSLHEQYAAAITDNPTYTTSIQFDGRSKSVRDYVGLKVGMPVAVDELEDKIDELVDTTRWVTGNAATFRALAEENWNFKSDEAADTLARIAAHGSAAAVCDLVSAGVPLNSYPKFGDTAVNQAARRGDLDMLRCLLKTTLGNDPVALSGALSCAAGGGQLDAVKVLLQSGANVSVTNSSDYPPLVAAAASGIPAVVQEILAYRPDINARGPEGRTALIAAVSSWRYGDLKNKEVDRSQVVRQLLAAGADVNLRDNEGETALIKNAWDPEIAVQLIQHGADVNAANNKGWTPLFSASSADLTEVLLRNGANPAIRNRNGKTPLEAAREFGDSRKVAVLEEAETGAMK